MNHRVSAIALILGSVTLFSPGCNKLKVAHSNDDPVYPLRGKHDAVPCVGCHGEGRPKALPTACIDCHEEDRSAPDHYPGQDCVGCHIEEGWQFVETVTYPTGATGPTGDTGGPTPVPDFDHSSFPDTQLCWENCHEADRKDETHYKDPKVNAVLWWDCSGCHTATAWDWEPIDHPVRIPHGVEAQNDSCSIRPENEWLTGCAGCHPNGTDTYVCFSCHTDPKTKEVVHGGIYQENGCLTCHEYAEAEDCPDQ